MPSIPGKTSTVVSFQLAGIGARGYVPGVVFGAGWFVQELVTTNRSAATAMRRRRSHAEARRKTQTSAISASPRDLPTWIVSTLGASSEDCLLTPCWCGLLVPATPGRDSTARVTPILGGRLSLSGSEGLRGD